MTDRQVQCEASSWRHLRDGIRLLPFDTSTLDSLV